MSLRLPRIVSLFSIHNNGEAISYIAASILGQMVRQGADAQLWVPTSDHWAHKPFIRNAVPSLLKGLAYRALGYDSIVSTARRRFLSALRPGDVAYIWPGPELDLYERAKDRGATLLREHINCPIATATAILEREAEATGLEWTPPFPQEVIDAERRQFDAADLHFAPSPMVADALRAEGVPDEKILATSYGWEPERIVGAPEPTRRAGGETRFLFVGSICLRKGVHRLIDAWRRAGSPGRLVLAGRVADDFPRHFVEALDDPTIELPGYTTNIGPVFRSSDVFVFPSFEEGGPLVTYEAMGAGLPVITTPMGAGTIAHDGEGAIILPPDDPEAWAEAMLRLASDPDLRAEMGRQGAARAAQFTWEKCAETRIKLLSGALARRECSLAATVE